MSEISTRLAALPEATSSGRAPCGDRHRPCLFHPQRRGLGRPLCRAQRRDRLQRRARRRCRRTARARCATSGSSRRISRRPGRCIRPRRWSWRRLSPASARRSTGSSRNRPGLAVGVVTADCGPVLFADAEERRRSAPPMPAGGARSAAFWRRRSRPWRRPAQSATRIRAVLGPTITQPNYEVGLEMMRRVPRRGARSASGSSRPAAAPTSASSTCPVSSSRSCAPAASSRTSSTVAPMASRTASSPSGAPRIAASRITAASFLPSRYRLRIDPRDCCIFRGTSSTRAAAG